MERLTTRDEFGNADIIGVDSAELQENLDFIGLNRVTDALNRLADYEDALPLDRAQELAQADSEGRIYIRGKVFRCPKCGSYSLTPRVDNKFYYCYHCKIQLTSEEVEAILEGRKSK